MENHMFIPVKKKSYKLQAVLYGRELLPKRVESPILGDTFTLEEDKSRIVMYGLLGEVWPISDEKFCTTYQSATGEAFTPEILDSILSDGRSYCELEVKTYPGKDLMWAIHVPLTSSYILRTKDGYELPVNTSGIEHYEGDYIVCPDAGGAPRLADIWPVNGRVFHRIYELAETLPTPLADLHTSGQEV